jgi:deferrochelatase/peroxidase EfeB
VSAPFKEAADVQGNILRGYRKPHVRHLVLEVTDCTAARRWLAACISGRSDGVPQITTEAPWTTKPHTCFNIGLTSEGLRALRAPSLDEFPREFIEGMSARAKKIGDTGPSAPETWPAPFNEPKRVHLIATIYADAIAQLDSVQHHALADGGGLKLLGALDGQSFPHDLVHFGYRDNISQPRFEGIHDPKGYEDAQPMAPLGTVLLGYETNFEGLMWHVPKDVGHNGSFNAFRVLAQDVAGFDAARRRSDHRTWPLASRGLA